MSDRADLADFLATGPNAPSVVAVPDTQGDFAAAERCYAAVLDLRLLSSPGPDA